MRAKIIVDSACDLPEHIRDEYDIKVLPFNIHLDNKTYLDGRDIGVGQVYNALRDEKTPTTSQVSPEIFKKIFTQNAKKGYDSIYISFSKKMSGAFQTGKLIAREIAANYPEIKIEVIDSRAGSVATGIIAYKAAHLLSKGNPIDKVVKEIKDWAEHIEHLFILDDLATLERGGRITKTKSFIGNILNIKPILHVVDGRIELLEKVRGSKRAVNRLISLFEEKNYNLKEQLIGIAHADDSEKAKKLKAKIEDLGGEIFSTEMISSVLGAHLGIGGLGLFFLNKP